MLYIIDYTLIVERQLLKLDKTTRDIILRKINKLQTTPSKRGKHLTKNLYELKHKNYRVYYVIFHGVVVIDKITYQGKVIVAKIGTKNTQKKDVKELKW